MSKNGFIRFTINFFKLSIVLFLIFESVYTGIAIFNKNIDNKFVLQQNNYGKNPLWLEDGDSNDIDLIYDKMDEVGEFATVYAIYKRACEKLMLTKAYGVRATSTIDVRAANITISVASNRTEQYLVAGVPEYNANQKVYSSYTNTIYVTDANDDFLASVLKGMIQFADRGYSDGVNSYKQKGKLSAMTEEGEVIEWATEYAPEEPTAARTYNDGEFKEKCNFVITPETILEDSVSVERVFDEQYGMYLYTVKMSLDCSNNDEGSATYYEAKAIGDVLGENMKSLTYSQMSIEMTLYSNGYMITWDTVQEWTLVYDILISKLSGTALNKKYEVFSYDPKECEVVDFTK